MLNLETKVRQMKQGVPQGEVLTPLLFNIHVSSRPLPSSKTIKVTPYADDDSSTTSGWKTNEFELEVKPYLSTLYTISTNR